MKNKLTKYRSVLVFLLFLSLFSDAAIYRLSGDQQQFRFTDTATENATPVQLKVANIYATQSKQSAAPAATTISKTYQKFSIAQPINHQTLQNQSQLSATIEIQPNLQAGDNIQWWLDGKLYQQTASTQLSITQLERGEHQLQAKLLDAQNHVLLTTPAVTFYVHLAIEQSISEQPTAPPPARHPVT